MRALTLLEVLDRVDPYLGHNARFELYMTLLPDLEPGGVKHVLGYDLELDLAIKRTYPHEYDAYSDRIDD